MPALRRRRLRRRGPGHGLRRQRGNGLLFALLGLVVSAIAAVSLLQNARLQTKREAGLAEASVLDHLRNATNNAIFEWMLPIQNGAAFSKNGVTVSPVSVDGELTWQPSIPQLAAMGYLPPGWTTQRSPLNDAPYVIAFHRVPAGCVVAACNIEGQVLLQGAIRAAGQASDGPVIGPILTRLGADAGVSLPSSADTISGYGNTWQLANPVPGQPAGVVAVRVGTGSSGYGQFVRIGDTRDPNLAGNLTVAGNTHFGHPGSRSDFDGQVQINNQPLALADASGQACVELQPAGRVLIHCDGQLDATRGVFTDANGQRSELAGTGLITSGAVQAADGLRTALVTAFPGADPGAITVQAGDLLVRNAAGTALLRIAANGDVSAAGQLVAGGTVQARQLQLTGTVQEGSACGAGAGSGGSGSGSGGQSDPGGNVALLASGGLAVCQGGHYTATSRFASLGASCGTAGQVATDTQSGDSLLCRNGRYLSTSGLLSARVHMNNFEVVHGDTISLDAALPQGCPAVNGAGASQALLTLVPKNDAATPGNPVINRIATWVGNGWRIALTDGAGLATASTAIAEVYCYYP